MTDKYKPFDLERALAGDKFIRVEDNKEPLAFHWFPEKNIMACVFADEHSWFRESNFDAFRMIPKKKKLFIGVEKTKTDGSHSTTKAYYKHADLINDCSQTWYDSNCQVVEIEVDDE